MKKSSLKVLCVLVLAVALVFALGSTALAAGEKIYKAGETVTLTTPNTSVLTAGNTYTWKAGIGLVGFSGSQSFVATGTSATLTFTAALPTGVSAALTDTITLYDSNNDVVTEFTVVVTPVPTLGTLTVTVGSVSTTYTELPTSLTFVQGSTVTLKFTGTFTKIVAQLTTNLGNNDIFKNDGTAETKFIDDLNKNGSATVVLKSVGTTTLFVQPAVQAVAAVVDGTEITVPAEYTGGAVSAIAINVVASVPATAVALDDATVAVGKNITLVPKFTPTNANGLSNATWTTSDDSIAIVTSTGMVYGLKVGEVTITYTVNNLKATCKVKVTATGAVDPVDPVDPPDTGDAFPIWIALMGVAAIAAGTFAVKKVRA